MKSFVVTLASIACLVPGMLAQEPQKPGQGTERNNRRASETEIALPGPDGIHRTAKGIEECRTPDASIPFDRLADFDDGRCIQRNPSGTIMEPFDRNHRAKRIGTEDPFNDCRSIRALQPVPAPVAEAGCRDSVCCRTVERSSQNQPDRRGLTPLPERHGDLQGA